MTELSPEINLSFVLSATASHAWRMRIRLTHLDYRGGRGRLTSTE